MFFASCFSGLRLRNEQNIAKRQNSPEGTVRSPMLSFLIFVVPTSSVCCEFKSSCQCSSNLAVCSVHPTGLNNKLWIMQHPRSFIRQRSSLVHDLLENLQDSFGIWFNETKLPLKSPFNLDSFLGQSFHFFVKRFVSLPAPLPAHAKSLVDAWNLIFRPWKECSATIRNDTTCRVLTEVHFHLFLPYGHSMES